MAITINISNCKQLQQITKRLGNEYNIKNNSIIEINSTFEEEKIELNKILDICRDFNCKPKIIYKG